MFSIFFLMFLMPLQAVSNSPIVQGSGAHIQSELHVAQPEKTVSLHVVPLVQTTTIRVN